MAESSHASESPATAPAAAAQPHPHEQTVTPWEVQGAEGVDGRLQAIDYTLLIKHFGTRPIDAALLARFERLTGVAPHRFLRRGIFFSHRELSHILDCHEQGKPWYLYTGRGPSSGAMHVGHMVPFIFCKWLQDVFHVPLVIQLTDDEKFLFKQELKMDAALRFANENAKDIIAFGFDPANTFIFSNLSYMNPDFYQNVVRIQKCITTSTSKAAFGFKDMDNVGKLAFVAVQACPAFSSTFPHVFGPKSNAHCLVPCFVAGTPVTLATGLSLPIEKVREGDTVLTWDREQQCITTAAVTALPRTPPSAELVELILEDGREIVCTPEHPFVTVTEDAYQDCAAATLQVGQRVAVNLGGVVANDAPVADWSLTTGDSTLRFDTAEAMSKTLAFARLVGFIQGDGSVSHTPDHIKIKIGTHMDAHAVAADIRLFVPTYNPEIHDEVSEIPCGEGKSSTHRAYALVLPSQLARMIIGLEDPSRGRCTDQETTWPRFVIDTGCPQPVVREFLAGLMGADGHLAYLLATPHLAHKHGFMMEVAIKQTCKQHLSAELERKMAMLIPLFDMFGVSVHMRRVPLQKDHVEWELVYNSNADAAQFVSAIGYRFCHDKALKSAVWSAYQSHMRYVETNVQAEQNDRKRNGRAEIPVSVDRNLLMSADEFLVSAGALEWFGVQETVPLSTAKAVVDQAASQNARIRKYVGPREATTLPVFNLRVARIRRFKPSEPVQCYDLTVNTQTPYFIANGAVVHNCAIDQDPYFRLTRDVAARLKLRKPALVHSKFFPALQGHGTKMSASDPNSAVYLSDTPAQIKNKIRKHAFSGGQVSREEHARLGGNPDVDVAYAYLTFFLDDDAELADLEARYRQGTLTTGEMKDRCVAVVGDVVGAVQARRKTVTDGTLQAFTTVRDMTGVWAVYQAASAEAAARAARHAAENAEAVETAPAAAETTAAPASAAS